MLQFKRGRISLFFGFLAAATLPLLAGCQTTQTTSTRLAENVAIISTKGNAFAESEDVLRDVLVNAAVTTQNAGYQYFLIASQQDTTRTDHFVTSGSSYTSGTINTYGGYGSYSGMTTYTPPQVHTFVKPGMDVMIRMFRDGEIDPNTPGVFNAASVIEFNPPKS